MGLFQQSSDYYVPKEFGYADLQKYNQLAAEYERV